MNSGGFVTPKEFQQQNPEIELHQAPQPGMRLAPVLEELQAQGFDFTLNQAAPAHWGQQVAIIRVALEQQNPLAEPAGFVPVEQNPLAQKAGGLAELQPHRGWARTHAAELAQAWQDAMADEAPEHGGLSIPWDSLPEKSQGLLVAAANRVLEHFPVLQRGGVWELAATEVHAYEPKPDPSLERIAVAMESIAAWTQRSKDLRENLAFTFPSEPAGAQEKAQPVTPLGSILPEQHS